jgi:membrane fusion protein, copper/silver efflux system
MKIKILLIYFTLFATAMSCRQKVNEEDPNVFYTCSMDPQVMEKKPGNCPICKMELTRTVLSPEQDAESIKLSATQIKLGNIRTEMVQTGSLNEGIELRATIAADERKISMITSRISGRIEKLYFRSEGEKINAGDPVYELYSDELQAAIKQYILLKEKSRQLDNQNVNYDQMLRSAKDKLLIWGLSEKLINTFSGNNIPQTIPFYSKKSGVITEIPVSEGDYLAEGSPVLNIADYSTLWVTAEVYPGQQQQIRAGQDVHVNIEAYPQDNIKGKVESENPELDAGSRINIIRIKIPDREGKYKPGMRAVVKVLTGVNKGISVPAEAVLFQPEMNMVWISDSNDVFRPRMVKTGIISDGKVEIISGLQEGEMIVTSGAYLIDSEYQLRKGAGGMAGMQHEGHGKTPSPAGGHTH